MPDDKGVPAIADRRKRGEVRSLLQVCTGIWDGAQTMQIKKEPRLTRAEAAEYLDVSVATLARWASQETGPTYLRLGRWTRYPISELEAFIATRRVTGQPLGKPGE